MTEQITKLRNDITQIASDNVDRKVPWWAWTLVAVAVLVFIGFFAMFAATVGTGDM